MPDATERAQCTGQLFLIFIDLLGIFEEAHLSNHGDKNRIAQGYRGKEQ